MLTELYSLYVVFSDDQVIFGQDHGDLEYMARELTRRISVEGNVDKTEKMCRLPG